MRRFLIVALLLLPAAAWPQTQINLGNQVKGQMDGGTATTTHESGKPLIQVMRHATDCTVITDGKAGELCVELDSEHLYSCQPTAGDCDSAGEWILTGDGAGPSLPISTANGGTGQSTTATSARYLKGDGSNWATSTGSASGTGACTNQVVGALNSDAAPTCVNISSAMITDGVVASGDLATANKTDTKSMTLFDPVTGDSGRIQFKFGKAVTITYVSCSVKAATSVTINLDKRTATTPDTAGTNALSAGLVCDTNEQTSCASGCDVNTIASAGVTARQPVTLTISGVSGTPDTLRVHVEYTVD